MKTLKFYALTAALIAASSASAISSYTDRAVFTAAVGGSGALTIEDFTHTYHFPITSGVLNSSTTEAGLAAGDIEAGATYSVPTPGVGNFFNIDGGGGFTGGFLDSIRHFHPLTVVFDTAISAFGFDTNALMGSSFDLQINYSNQPSFSDTYGVSGSSSMQFFGFQSSTSNIESVLIRGNSQTFDFALDNFTFGGDGAPPAEGGPEGVPDSGSTFAMLAAAFIGFVCLRRKLRD